MKNLKSKIEKILKKLQSGHFKDYPAVGSEIQIASEELLSLFKQQMKELVGEKRICIGFGCLVHTPCLNCQRNETIDKLLKNIEL